MSEVLADVSLQLVAEVGLAVLLGPVGVRLARHASAGTGLHLRRVVARGDEARVHQRAPPPDPTLALQLPVHRLERPREHLALGRLLTEAADRRLVRRAVRKTPAAEPAERH